MKQKVHTWPKILCLESFVQSTSINDTAICHRLQVKHWILCTDSHRLKQITNSMTELCYINANTKSKWGETQITSYLQFFEVRRYLKPISHTMTNTVSRNNEPVRECDFPVCVYSDQYVRFCEVIKHSVQCVRRKCTLPFCSLGNMLLKVCINKINCETCMQAGRIKTKRDN